MCFLLFQSLFSTPTLLPTPLNNLRTKFYIFHVEKYNIIRFEEYYEDETDLKSSLLITELCAEGCLQALISNSQQGMPRTQLLRVLSQITGALSYLHDKKLFHSDVKPANILIRRREPLEAVLADCADIKHFGDKSEAHGTELFYSPYTLLHGHFEGPGDDIWAFGICYLGMLGQWPLIEWDDLGTYPSRCLQQTKELQRLNKEHDLVCILGRMLCESTDSRAEAAELGMLATEAMMQDMSISHGEPKNHNTKDKEEKHKGKKGEKVTQNDLGIKRSQDIEVFEWW